MRPYDKKERPFITKKTRARYIERCRELTRKSDDPQIPNGAFPLDHDVPFEDLSHKELLEYVKAYEWALNPENFKTFK